MLPAPLVLQVLMSHVHLHACKYHAICPAAARLGGLLTACSVCADKGPTLHLCYLRHAFGLGEHYNSVQRLEENGHDEAAPESELADS